MYLTSSSPWIKPLRILQTIASQLNFVLFAIVCCSLSRMWKIKVNFHLNSKFDTVSYLNCKFDQVSQLHGKSEYILFIAKAVDECSLLFSG